MKRLEEGSGNTRIRKYAIAKDLTQSTVRLSSEAPAISVLDKGLFTYRCTNLGGWIGVCGLGPELEFGFRLEFRV